MQSEFYSWSELFPDYDTRMKMISAATIAQLDEENELSLAEE
jgi:hypothetical protein